MVNGTMHGRFVRERQRERERAASQGALPARLSPRLKSSEMPHISHKRLEGGEVFDSVQAVREVGLSCAARWLQPAASWR